MATEQRFEGPSLDDVLAQVRRALGDDAEILEANRIAAPGGIGADRYEVRAKRAKRGQRRMDPKAARDHVNPLPRRPRTTTPPARPSTGASPSSLAEGAYPGGLDDATVQAAMDHVQQVMADLERKRIVEQHRGTPSPTSLVDLADQVDDLPLASGTQAPSPFGDDDPGFAHLLAEARKHVADSYEAQRAQWPELEALINPERDEMRSEGAAGHTPWEPLEWSAPRVHIQPNPDLALRPEVNPNPEPDTNPEVDINPEDGHEEEEARTTGEEAAQPLMENGDGADSPSTTAPEGVTTRGATLNPEDADQSVAELLFPTNSTPNQPETANSTIPGEVEPQAEDHPQGFDQVSPSPTPGEPVPDVNEATADQHDTTPDSGDPDVVETATTPETQTYAQWGSAHVDLFGAWTDEADGDETGWYEHLDDPEDIAPYTSPRNIRLVEWLNRNDLTPEALAQALDGLPRPDNLPQGPGVIVAIVGEGPLVLPLARRMAIELESDPAKVVLASNHRSHASVPDNCRISTTGEAALDRRAWRRRSEATMVAVDTTSSLAEHAQDWAHDILESLQPHQVIALVDAGRKPEDIARWITDLGGVDAIALTGLEETVSPHAILELGIPVARLGHHVATSTMWADLLRNRRDSVI